MGITIGNIPAQVTDAEIRARIEELQETTEVDGIEPWWSVEALERELEARGVEVPGFWADSPFE